MENSKIEWTEHTFNPWLGCTKISAACDFCYAESWALRYGFGDLWQGNRRRTSARTWNQVLKWNKAAPLTPGWPKRPRVFCASLADVFDNQVPEEWREDLFGLIAETPHLDWLLLTKRPQNIRKMTKAMQLPWPHVAIGATIESQLVADRSIDYLLEVEGRHFLSCEPLLGEIDLKPWLWRQVHGAFRHETRRELGEPHIGLVISGGESGTKARPSLLNWHRQIRDQCETAGVPYHFKQWGEYQGLEPWEDGEPRVERKGKAVAGRILDGRTHDGELAQ